jgi:hypothetical protein
MDYLFFERPISGPSEENCAMQKGKTSFAHCNTGGQFCLAQALSSIPGPSSFFPKVYFHTVDTIDVWRNPSGKGGEAEAIARRLLAKLTVS